MEERRQEGKTDPTGPGAFPAGTAAALLAPGTAGSEQFLLLSESAHLGEHLQPLSCWVRLGTAERRQPGLLCVQQEHKHHRQHVWSTLCPLLCFQKPSLPHNDILTLLRNCSHKLLKLQCNELQ